MRRVTRMVIGSVALAVAVTACGGGSGGADEPAATSFSAHAGEPASLIPGDTNESEGGKVLGLLFAPLTDIDPETGEPTMLVAKWVRSQDQQHWTIRLKDGWTFHNGEPVTAQSFVGAWNATVYNGWNNAYFFTDVLGIEGASKVAKKKAKTMAGLKAPDDKTIKVSLDAPNVNLPLIIRYTAFYPMPESVLKQQDWKKFNEKPIGNGQYEMAGKWKHNRSITLTKYAHYGGRNPGKADEITFTIYSQPSAAYNDVIAGELDVDDNLPTARLRSAPQDFGDRYIEAPSSEFTYLGFPLWLERFQDVRVREAFSMAIDREEIDKQIFAGTVEPAKSLVSPLVKLGHRDDACGEACEFNPQKAVQLLEQTDFDTSKTVTFWFNSGAGNDDWVQAVANQIHNNLGVPVELKSQQWAQYVDTTDNHEVTGPYRLGWIMDYPSPANYIGPMYSTGGSSNGTGYSNDVVDRALGKGNSADSPREAVKYYHKAEDAVIDDMPSILLWFGTNKVVHSPHVSNITFDAQGYLQYDQVTVVD